MMFYHLFIQKSRSEIYPCTAPPENWHIEPVPDGYTPFFVEVMTRHGARTPQIAYMPAMYRGYWVCDSDDAIAPHMFGTQIINNSYRRIHHVRDPRLIEFLPNCVAGDLLLDGMFQHVSLGKFYGNYLRNDLKLFSGNPSTDQIYLRCTDIDRTLRSAQSFLYGAFEPQQPNEVYTLEMGHEDLEILRPKEEFCADFDNLTKVFYSSEWYLNWASQAWSKLNDIATKIGITENTPQNLLSIADWIATYACNNQSLPFDIDEELIRFSQNAIGVFHYTMYKHVNRFIPGSYIMREYIRIAENAIKDGKLKFSLLSHHDSSIMTILTMLNVSLSVDDEHSYPPPYASALSLEFYKNKDGEVYARWLLNGEVLVLPDMDNKPLFKWEDFKEKFKEINDYCGEFPKL